MDTGHSPESLIVSIHQCVVHYEAINMVAGFPECPAWQVPSLQSRVDIVRPRGNHQEQALDLDSQLSFLAKAEFWKSHVQALRV